MKICRISELNMVFNSILRSHLCILIQIICIWQLKDRKSVMKSPILTLVKRVIDNLLIHAFEFVVWLLYSNANAFLLSLSTHINVFKTRITQFDALDSSFVFLIIKTIFGFLVSSIFSQWTHITNIEILRLRGGQFRGSRGNFKVFQKGSVVRTQSYLVSSISNSQQYKSHTATHFLHFER